MLQRHYFCHSLPQFRFKPCAEV